jgi:hypothetical protein
VNRATQALIDFVDNDFERKSGGPSLRDGAGSVSAAVVHQDDPQRTSRVLYSACTVIENQGKITFFVKSGKHY